MAAELSSSRRRRAPVLALVLVACVAWLGGARIAAAAETPLRENAIPSCYEQLKDNAPRQPGSDLTIIVDQTVAFDQRLQQIVLESVERLIEPATQVSVVAFSAFLPGRYLDVLVAGRTEARFTGRQRDFVPKRVLLASDQCLDEQLPFARRLVAKALRNAFARSDPSLARSDILTALHDVSRRIGESRAERRLVIVVSDMLENSSITSFYQGGQLRRIEVDAELKKVSAAGVRADFHGAEVVVIGAGMGLPGAAQSLSYRDPRALLALEDFWRRWFAASNASVAEFGKPTPLVEIKWPAAKQP